jgi:hypothetical protein
MSPTPAVGASIVFENHNLFNLPIEVPESPPPASRRRGSEHLSGRRKSASETRPAPPESGLSNRGSLGRAANSQLNLPDFAKGLLDRGEALGINKTFMNAVSEIKVRLASDFDMAADNLWVDGRETFLTLRRTSYACHQHMELHIPRIRSWMSVPRKHVRRGIPARASKWNMMPLNYAHCSARLVLLSAGSLIHCYSMKMPISQKSGPKK